MFSKIKTDMNYWYLKWTDSKIQFSENMGNKKTKDVVGVAPSTEQEVVNWNGNLKKHKYTDVICLIIFLIFLIVWAVVGVISILQGDINKVGNSSTRNYESTTATCTIRLWENVKHENIHTFRWFIQRTQWVEYVAEIAAVET